MKETYISFNAKIIYESSNPVGYELTINRDSRKVELTWNNNMFSDVLLTSDSGEDVSELEASLGFMCEKIKEAVLATNKAS